MGWKYEVLAWIQKVHKGSGETYYTDVQVYAGNSLIKAIKAMFQARKVSGCVSLKVR